VGHVRLGHWERETGSAAFGVFVLPFCRKRPPTASRKRADVVGCSASYAPQYGLHGSVSRGKAVRSRPGRFLRRGPSLRRPTAGHRQMRPSYRRQAWCFVPQRFMLGTMATRAGIRRGPDHQALPGKTIFEVDAVLMVMRTAIGCIRRQAPRADLSSAYMVVFGGVGTRRGGASPPSQHSARSRPSTSYGGMRLRYSGSMRAFAFVDSDSAGRRSRIFWAWSSKQSGFEAKLAPM